MRHVLKANEVQFADPLRLPLDPTAPLETSVPTPASGPAHIRIVENHPKYALVEVTCSCGTTTQVRCDYAPAPA